MKNKRTRTQSAIRIALSSSIRVIIGIVMTFASRTLFICLLGAEYLSLNGLFTNILTVLSLADLGIGSAIVFFLYKPIVDNDKGKIIALIGFYRNCYRLIGFTILIIGLFIMPFLPQLVNFDAEVEVNLYLVYFLFLLNTTCTYLLFAYKQCILQANQQGYIIENITSIFTIINSISDFIVLLVWKDYILYLIIRLILVLIKNLIIGYYADKNFIYLKSMENSQLSKDEKKYFFKSLYNISIFNIGDRLINSTDNIIISAFLGTILVGYYSNYYMIVTQLRAGYSAIMKSFQAGIGNVIAANDKNKFQIYKKLSFINHFLGTLCTVELCQVFNSFIYVWIGRLDDNYLLSQEVVIIIALNFYYDNSTWILNMFREANGDFKIGRYISLFTGIANILLSISLVKRFGLPGVLLSTILCKYLIAVFPFVFGIGNRTLDGRGFFLVKEYWVHFITMIICMIISWQSCRWLHLKGNLYMVIIEGMTCCIVVCIVFILFYGRCEEFKFMWNEILNIKHRVLRSKE